MNKHNNINIIYRGILMDISNTSMLSINPVRQRSYKKSVNMKSMNMKSTNTKSATKNMPIDNFKIVTMYEYEKINTISYKVCQLKEMCKHYKLKQSGNKNELINRLYYYLRYSLYAINIQRLVRGYLLREYIASTGPAMKNRALCVNDTDFATMEPLKEIAYNQFYSFQINDSVYGCDIYSLNQLINKVKPDVCNRGDNEIKNPYNREIIPPKIIAHFNRYLRLAKLLKIPFQIVFEEEDIDPKKKMEMRIIELFQYINELGNYADSTWFSNLPRHMLVLFIREVYDIWNYRAQLSVETMRDIVPNHGNPFMGMSLHLAQSQGDDFLKNTALRIIELLVKSGHTTENRSLGAYYVLAALTLVSQNARNALPWLYQSVAH